jgi:hypothetical protein
MSAINKIPRGLKVLIVMVILAVLVWKFAVGNYFYPAVGIAIIFTFATIFIVYKSSRAASFEGNQNRKNKSTAGASEESIQHDKTFESEDNSSNPQLLNNNKNNLTNRSIEIKQPGTDVAARYMNMAKNTQVSEGPQSSPKLNLHKEVVSKNEVQDNNSFKNSVEEIPSENNDESPMPLIDDETSLSVEEKNQLVNAVWYRCENPFCKFTQFITVHHIIEEKDGGTNKLDNLIVLCPYCHDLAHRKEIPEKEMRDWISNREERFKFILEWHYN